MIKDLSKNNEYVAIPIDLYLTAGFKISGSPEEVLVHKSNLKYLNYPSLPEIINSEKLGLLLQKVGVKCKKCSKDTINIRGEYKDVYNCIEVEGGGFCSECKLITYFEFRFYGDRFIEKTDKGWEETKQSIWRKILNVITECLFQTRKYK